MEIVLPLLKGGPVDNHTRMLGDIDPLNSAEKNRICTKFDAVDFHNNVCKEDALI